MWNAYILLRQRQIYVNLLDLEVTPTFMRKYQPTVLRYDIRMFLRDLWKGFICIILKVVLVAYIDSNGLVYIFPFTQNYLRWSIIKCIYFLFELYFDGQGGGFLVCVD